MRCRSGIPSSRSPTSATASTSAQVSSCSSRILLNTSRAVSGALAGSAYSVAIFRSGLPGAIRM